MTNPLLDALRPQPTGGLIVTFKEGVEHAHQEGCLRDAVGAGVRTLSADDPCIGQINPDVPSVLIGSAGIGVVSDAVETQAAHQRLLTHDVVQDVRPEFWMFALDVFEDTAEATWGLQAVGAPADEAAGRGIKVCVLDTGIDLGHPDYEGRQIVARSFVTGETENDGNGHGTHCAGSAAGRSPSGNVPRYGVAPGAELYVGKVLGDQGSGRERDILAGMLWAINEGCEVISMSLGRAVREGELPSQDYERLGQMALDRGSLIIAAAGNDSARRYGYVAPVGAPANSVSIMAVAAVDQGLDVAEFSSSGVNGQGGEVNVAAPGVGVFSSVPMPELYRILRGTSMACPHVAGVAALWAARDANLRGQRLWQRLVDSAQSLPLAERDVGRGLAQAPSVAVS